MADITVVAASVIQNTGAADTGTAGEAIVQGQSLYLKAADSKLWKADNNAALPEAAVVKGIALNCASPGQPVKHAKGGQLVPGATLVKGTIYVLSATAGGICPAADLASGNRVSIIGVASSAANLELGISNTGIVI